jgi:hypothetical protein
MHLIAFAQQPIDIIDAPTARVDAHNRALSFGLIQLQGAFGRFDQGTQGFVQLDFALKQPLHHDFFVPGADHIAFLTPTPVALFGKIAFGSKPGLFATRSPGHIRIQYLPIQLIIVSIGLAVASKDRFHRLMHLEDILLATSIQGILHHRLLRTARPTEGTLQAHIRFQTLVDFDQTLAHPPTD